MDDRRLLDTSHADPAAAVERIAEEFRAGFAIIDRIDRPAVTIFGSARVREGTQSYELAHALGRAFGERGWAVITGGGPGTMEAANRGAREAGALSIGFNIRLPHEQASNAYLDLSYTFEHFYARKVCFVKPAEGFVIVPGGFGTLDELFEALTLIQTGTVRNFPVVLLGRAYWQGLLDWERTQLLGAGLIAERDVDLLHLTDDVDEAVELVIDCYDRRCADVRAPAL